MSKVLLLGNGFNRCFDEYTFSWQDLLEELKSDSLRKQISDGDKPFSLLYEEIYLMNHRNNGISEEQMMKRVQELIRKLKTNILFQTIKEVGVEKYITTNYDYLIEESIFNSNYSTSVTYGDGLESKYRIRTRNILGNSEVWHVHGEIDYPSTIVLGHKMYSEVIRSISDYIYKYLTDESKTSWIDYFFKDTIYMLGYGLSYSDVTLWYILNERARRIVSGNVAENRVVFFIHSSDSRINDLTSLLNAHYVEIVKSDDNESYVDFYNRALNVIKHDKM